MAQEKQHLTTEQLSALLDSEVTAEEQAQWQAHLSTCRQCQQELASLRQTVMLLHVLPAPPLPRSFVLPVEAAGSVVPVVPLAPTPIPISRAQRRTLNPYVRGILRTLSGLAAVIGVVFFLSGVLPALLMHGIGGTSNSGTTTTASGVTAGSNQSALSPHVVAPSQEAHPTPTAKLAEAKGLATLTSTPIATILPTPIPTSLPSGDQSSSGGYQNTTPFWPTVLLFNLSLPAVRIGLGMALVILGWMGFVLFKGTKRRAHL